MAQSSQTRTKKVSLSNIATLLMITSLIGQVLGFLRTQLVSSNFTKIDPGATDAFFAAFTIPDFFFFTLAAGALGVAFMPVLSDRLHRGDRKGVWELSNSLMNLLTIIMAAIGVLIFIFADPLIRHVVGTNLANDPKHFNEAVTILRLIAFNPMLFAISGVMSSTQQVLGRFFFYAIAPLFYNLSIIISVFIFRGNVGITGLGLGAVIGAVLQLLIIGVGLLGLRFSWRPKITWHSKDFRTVLRQLPARSLDQGMDQIGNIIDTNRASKLSIGSISNYNYAYTLHTAPILLLGTAISTAAFPRLTARLSQNRPDLFRKDFLMVLRLLIWLVLPVAVISFFGRGYLVRILLKYADSEVSTIFGFLVAAIIFRTLYAIISRWFYANKDTKTPLFVSVFTIGLNIILSFTLARPNAYGVVGLAIAQSIVAAVEVVILMIIITVRDRKLFDNVFWGACSKIVSVTGFTLLSGYIAAAYLPLGSKDIGIWTLGSKLLLISGIIFGVHFLMSWIFGLEEVQPIINRVKRLIFKPVRYFDQP